MNCGRMGVSDLVDLQEQKVTCRDDNQTFGKWTAKRVRNSVQ